jgi:cytochrome P450
MLMHPEAQTKIQEELDESVGRGNAPTSSAVQSMQYLNAAWKESLRLNPPLPTSESSRVAQISRLIENTGVPHFSTSEDVWKDRVIPQGTMVLCNIGSVRSFWFDEVPKCWL